MAGNKCYDLQVCEKKTRYGLLLQPSQVKINALIMKNAHA